MATPKNKSQRKVRLARSGGSLAHPTYEQWKAMGVKGATEYAAKILQLDADRKRKLATILRHEWEKPANHRI